MKLKRRTGKPARVEMLPLIDVVFLLLVFFIYAMLSMSIHRGLHLELPLSSQSELSQEESPIQLSVQSGSELPLLTIDREPVALGDLAARLHLLGIEGGAENSDPPPVLLFAEKGLPYQQLFLVLDELKKGGISNISLQARME
ncbi:MAG: biopolymer transporter ExbD [Desulforhopalus sp.]|jgi:biopolymer transport protein ExbD|nr:biopolymer transporter ExbD [Desulforhopalus sp.]